MSCHMIADSMDELHRFARSIGLRREWLHDSRACPHYDLTPDRRFDAVRQGAMQLETPDFVAKMKFIRERLMAGGYWARERPAQPSARDRGPRQKQLL